MEYNHQDHEWRDILSSGTEIRIHKNGRIAANNQYETPQTIRIVESSDNEISSADPHLSEEFAGLPTSVTIQGVPITSNRFTETDFDIIHIIESVQRGDSEVVKT